MRDPDLIPLPVWRQKLARYRDQWRRSKDRRHRAWVTLQSAVTLALTLAFTLGGATLISFGVYRMYAPAGYITGGIMCWLLQWAAGETNRRRE